MPSCSAASIQSMNMCAAFAELGHQVEMIAAPGRAAAADFRFYGLPPSFAIRRIDRTNILLHALRSSSHLTWADLVLLPAHGPSQGAGESIDRLFVGVVAVRDRHLRAGRDVELEHRERSSRRFPLDEESNRDLSDADLFAHV